MIASPARCTAVYWMRGWRPLSFDSGTPMIGSVGSTRNSTISTRPCANDSMLIANGKRSSREISCAVARSGLMT